MFYILFISQAYSENLGSLANISIQKDIINMELIIPMYAVSTVCGLNTSGHDPLETLQTIRKSLKKVKSHMLSRINIYVDDEQKIPDITPPEIAEEGYIIFNLSAPGKNPGIKSLKISYDYQSMIDHSDKLSICFYNRLREPQNVSIAYLYGQKKTALWTDNETKVINLLKTDWTKYIRLSIILIAAILIFHRTMMHDKG